LTCAAAHAGDWPRFRGPNGTGVSADKDVPIQWTATEGVLWKTPIPGRGNSSPITWGDRVFIQSSAADGSERWLLCLNAASGEVLWKQSAAGAAAYTHPKNTLASSTPATDGDRVYAVFWDGKDLLLNAYDFKGVPVWSRNLGGFVSEHGAGISPIVYDGKVILADDQGDKTDKPPSRVLAFHAKDGTDAWKAERKSFRASYSTPFILKSDQYGRRHQLQPGRRRRDLELRLVLSWSAVANGGVADHGGRIGHSQRRRWRRGPISDRPAARR
jgi:hypothetical protein